MRLLSITPRRSLRARLDDLLSSRFALQSQQDRITRTEELSPALQCCVNRLAPACAWRAHSAVEGVFCAIARDASRARGAAPGDLEAYFVDTHGWVYSAAVWAHDSKHGWWLNSILEPCYDCDNGWWLGALMAPPYETQTESAIVSQDYLQLARPAE